MYEAQTIGSSGGNRHRKIDAITDRLGSPVAFRSMPGPAAYHRAIEYLLADLLERCTVHPDRTYNVSQEEYIGAIARWHGVADADMPYVLHIGRIGAGAAGAR